MGALLPYQVEQWRDGHLAVSLARTSGPRINGILPVTDSTHVYQEGRIATSIIRSFSNIEEKSAPPPEAVATRNKIPRDSP